MLIQELDTYLEVQDDIDYELFEEIEEEQCLWLEKRRIRISKYKIDIRAGYCEIWDEAEEAYAMDFDFYMIFDTETNQHLYEEAGSSMEVCLYNFLKGQGYVIIIDDILALECKVN